MTTNLIRSRVFQQRVRMGVWLAAVSCSMAWASTDENPPEPTAGVRTSHVLIVGGLQGETTTISPAEFAQLPRTEIEASVPHSDQQAKYEGVLLDRLFQEAGVRPGDPESGTQLARPFRSAYVLIEAADGYQVVLSIAEVFPQLGGRGVLLADRKNGQPLEAKAAPYQLVVIDSVGHERWVRQVTRILVRPASASPFPGHTAVPEPTAETALAGGVFVVGTGPGAPDLITVRAANILRRADRVYCFSWMKDELAPFVQPGVVEVASPWLRGGQYCGQDPAACAPNCGRRSSKPTKSSGDSGRRSKASWRTARRSYSPTTAIRRSSVPGAGCQHTCPSSRRPLCRGSVHSMPPTRR